MKIIRASDIRAMPWKNGGGMTSEIAIYPEDSQVAGSFLWRASIADVNADGPFSRFPGYDRHIMLIAGGGMTLDLGERGLVDVGERFQPRFFSGDWEVFGRLRAGPVRDFNLMVRRDSATGTLDVQTIKNKTNFGSKAMTLIHVLEGDIVAGAHVASTGESVVLGSGELASVNMLDAPACVAIASISLRNGA